MHFKDLHGMPIVSVAGADKLGTVDTLFIDPRQQIVLGIRVRVSGVIVHHEALLFGDVQSFGSDALTVSDGSHLNDQSKFPALQNAPDLGTVIGARVIKESGDQVGSVSDVDVNPATGAIDGYLLGENLMARLRHHEHLIPSSEVKSVGTNLVIVKDEAVAGTP